MRSSLIVCERQRECTITASKNHWKLAGITK